MTKTDGDRKNRSLGGVVLIMVVSVMLVLIVLLLATMAAVSTAQNRYYTKYEENQAYYTARSVLDVYTQKLLKDTDYYAYDGSDFIMYEYGDGDEVEMKQGLALQLDLYKLKAQSGENVAQSVLETYANANSGVDEYKKYFGIDTSGNDIQTDSSGNEFMEYEITYFPKLSDSTNIGTANKAYGDMVDRQDGIQAVIKVEVLDRSYYISPDILNAKIADGTYADRAAFFASASSDLAEAIINGSRSKDTMKLKVTTTVTYMGIESQAAVIYSTSEPPASSGSRAITSFGDMELKNMNIVGGGATTKPVNWDNNGEVYGEIYADNTWHYASSGAKAYLTDSECFFINGTATGDSGCFSVIGYEVSDPTDKNKRPYVYCSGAFSVENGKIGNYDGGQLPDQKIDLVTNGIGRKGNDFKVNGDIYCKGTCDLSWNTNVNVNGDLYVDGDLITNGKFTVVDGAPILTYPGITGNVYVSGSIDGVAITGDGSGFKKLTETINLTTDADAATEAFEIALPGGVKKVRPTFEGIYGPYYKVDTNGNTITPYTIVTAEEKAFSKQEEMDKGIYSTKRFTEADVGTTGTLSCANNNGGLLLDGVPQPGWTINTSSKLAYVLKGDCGSTKKYGGEGGNPSQYMYISGGGTVELLLEAGGTYWGNIVVADDTELKVYAPDGNYTFEKFAVWTETMFNAYKDARNNTQTFLNVGDEENCNIKVPKIYYYFTENTEITTNNEFFLGGYFYGPGAVFSAVKQKMDFYFNYNGNNLLQDYSTQGKKLGVTFIGAIVCEKLLYQNALGGVAYINPDLGGGYTPGEPIFAWQAYKYTRN